MQAELEKAKAMELEHLRQKEMEEEMGRQAQINELNAMGYSLPQPPLSYGSQAAGQESCSQKIARNRYDESGQSRKRSAYGLAAIPDHYNGDSSMKNLITQKELQAQH